MAPMGRRGVPLSSLAALAVLVMMGCAPGAAPRTTLPAVEQPVDPAAAGAEQLAAQTTVALRVSREVGAEPGARVRVVAVVHDRDGGQRETDLGAYAGSVLERPPEGDELIRIAIEDGDRVRALHLTVRGDHIEAAHSSVGDGGAEVIERIPVSGDVPVRVGDPAVETPGVAAD